MNPPIAIQRYFVAEQSCTANPKYDIKREMELNLSEFSAEPQLTRAPDLGPDMWQMALTLRHTPAEKSNAPYSFRLVMVGIFESAKEIPEEAVERVVRGNGASMLMGAAREYMRIVTSAGPFGAILLPTVSFFQPKPGTNPAQTRGSGAPIGTKP